MYECDYCEESFEDEGAYLGHLGASHRDELGRIDRRRVAAHEGDDEGLPIGAGPLALGGIVLVGVVLIGVQFVLAGGNGGGGNGGDGPTNLWGVHYHGTIDATIGGEPVDFSRDEYQLQADAFHFENGDGDRWHGHAEDVTLAYAMGTLDIEVTESTVTHDGTTYRADDPDTTVIVEVNGESVTPSEYVLQEGDHVRIVANRSG